MAQPESGLAPELVATEVAFMLFEGAHDVERWDVRWRHGGVEVEKWVYFGREEISAGEEDKAEEKTPPSPAESFVILTVLRGKQLGPMHTGFKLQEGDVAAVAIWADERERAVEVLRELGWAPHVEEEDSSAENV